ncbi:hypothetical protein LB504_009635 [Fusarium proliferatum]|nr:hypothetical protein LB504_009635 [Fusarium proliferatum]
MGATPGVDTSFHARSTTATLPAIDTAIQQTSTTSSNPSVVSPETSEISRSQELGTAIDTDNPPSDTSLSTTLYEGPTGRITTSVHESMTTEKTLTISRQPTRTSAVPFSEVALANSIVTGTGGTVATYVPEQNKDYILFTGTTTTTDDNGAAIVIFPFGWFWKLYGVPGGSDAAKPPAPTAKPVPEKEPGDKNEDDNDTDHDGASTKEDEKSTMVSTILSTTQGPTSASTTTEETTTSEEYPDRIRRLSNSHQLRDGYTSHDNCDIDTGVYLGRRSRHNPVGIVPDDAYTADVDPEIVAALEAEWAEIFGGDDGWNDTETTILTSSTALEESVTTSLTKTDATPTVTSDGSTNAVSIDLTSNTEATATFAIASDTIYSVSTVASTFITRTRGTDSTTDMLISTDEECIAYTEFPSQITVAPETGPITDEPIQQPITTTTDGTVLVWSAYVLDYINIPGITKITQSVGVDSDGGGQCGTGDGLSKGLREACDRAINKYEDNTVYSDYASRYSRSTKGILVAASVGQAACIAKFQCDNYGIGMKGSDIKEARGSAKENDGVDICGHIHLSNSCTIIIDYCTNCKTRG